MTPEKLFHELLGLGQNWRVEECEFDKREGVVKLKIAETEELWKSQRSPEMGGKVKCYDHTEELVWRHLNVFEYKCEIRCRLPRAKCIESGKVYRIKPPWEGLSKHFTKGFEAMALILMREMPVAAVARHVRESDTRLWRMLKAHVAVAYGESDWSNVKSIGCDEMSIRKGHCYVSVFCDLEGKRVLYATEGKDKKVWAKFAQQLKEQHGKKQAIREASIDMSPAYKAGIEENFEGAKIVYDKYHLIAKVNEAVDSTRKEEMKNKSWSKWSELKKSRWIWLKNPENLSEKQKAKYDSIDKENLCTAKAYQMRLTLQDIYQIAHYAVAKRKLIAWCRWVRRVAKNYPSRIFAKMVKCAQTIEHHLVGILGHWENKTTNAFLEGLNSVFSAVKRRARGFRSSTNLIAMLYFTAAKLRIPAFH